MKMRKIILPLLIVAIAGCKDKPKQTVAIKPKCPAIKIDTVLQFEDSCTGCAAISTGIGYGTYNPKTGCPIDEGYTEFVYPILNHSEIMEEPIIHYIGKDDWTGSNNVTVFYTIDGKDIYIHSDPPKTQKNEKNNNNSPANNSY